jgi:ribosomal protein L23
VRRRGWVAGLTPAWKKAMVVLAEGQTIDVL